MAEDNSEKPKPGSAEYDLQQIFLQEPMPDNPPYNPPDPQEPKPGSEEYVLRQIFEPIPDHPSRRTRIRRIGNRNLVIYPSGNTPELPTTSGKRHTPEERSLKTSSGETLHSVLKQHRK